MKEKIRTLMHEIASENGVELNSQIDADTVLLESGLDSLGFAILIARLEEELGYDPFPRPPTTTPTTPPAWMWRACRPCS